MNLATPEDAWSKLSGHLIQANREMGLSPLDAELLSRFIFAKFGREGHREGPSILTFPDPKTIQIEYTSEKKAVEHTFNVAIIAQRFLQFERLLPEFTASASRLLLGPAANSPELEDFLQMLKARILFCKMFPPEVHLRQIMSETLADYKKCTNPDDLKRMFSKLNRQQAEDSIGEFYSQWHGSIKNYRGLCSPKTLAGIIIKRIIARVIKEVIDTPKTVSTQSEDGEDPGGGMDVPDPRPGPINKLCVETCLLVELKKMTIEEQILLLRERDGHSFIDICERLEGKSDAATVAKYKMRAMRARQKLKAQLPDCVCIKKYSS